MVLSLPARSAVAEVCIYFSSSLLFLPSFDSLVLSPVSDSLFSLRASSGGIINAAFGFSSGKFQFQAPANLIAPTRVIMASGFTALAYTFLTFGSVDSPSIFRELALGFRLNYDRSVVIGGLLVVNILYVATLTHVVDPLGKLLVSKTKSSNPSSPASSSASSSSASSPAHSDAPSSSDSSSSPTVTVTPPSSSSPSTETTAKPKLIKIPTGMRRKRD
jgi:hypothetical protein